MKILELEKQKERELLVKSFNDLYDKVVLYDGHALYTKAELAEIIGVKTETLKSKSVSYATMAKFAAAFNERDFFFENCFKYESNENLPKMSEGNYYTLHKYKSGDGKFSYKIGTATVKFGSNSTYIISGKNFAYRIENDEVIIVDNKNTRWDGRYWFTDGMQKELKGYYKGYRAYDDEHSVEGNFEGIHTFHWESNNAWNGTFKTINEKSVEIYEGKLYLFHESIVKNDTPWMCDSEGNVYLNRK